MSDLYVNSNLVKSDFKSDETYKFEDIWGGSTNQVELKDGDTVIDKHQFKIKTPEAKWYFMTMKGNNPQDVQEVITREFADSNETTIELDSSMKQSVNQFLRANFAFETERIFTMADEQEAEEISSHITADNMFLFNDDTKIEFDGHEMKKDSNDGKGIATFNFTTQEALDSSQSDNASDFFGVIGVTKQVVISNVIVKDIPDPQTFTINIKWV